MSVRFLSAKDDVVLKEMANFLICETRKRDAMADELTKVYDIVTYASQMTENLSYKGVLCKLAEIIEKFKIEIAEKLKP